MSVALIPPGLAPRLLMSLPAWTWQGAGPDGSQVAHLLITHTAAPTNGGTAATAEDRRRQLSACRRGLTGTREVILLLGLDLLPRSADAARLDTYLAAALAADRLLFGRIQLSPSVPRADVCPTCGGSGTDPISGRACPDCSPHC
ncbi:hypothetical protein RM574_21705 [Streptomyces sp. DSM 41982]|uniref:Uncharacterized protein n=1 Tax=Streptomyces evansiae TaxID=3075535 RepID=A0ABD5E9J8_9ACTN|nr:MULTISPECIES: hypothetical protein [unclassified Streptomyces]MDT0418105.1 hypothetical protein [Streptomyces sp. DSM 41982]SCE16854.1 hypothetical protein GA0115246_111846 [Streptomyces sp. SolWspMP-sol7th]